MFSTEGNSTIGRTANAALTGSVCALFGISATLFASAAFIAKLNTAPRVRVDLQQWAWVKTLNFSSEKILVQEEAPLRSPEPILITKADLAKSPLLRARPKRAPKVHRQAREHSDRIHYQVAAATATEPKTALTSGKDAPAGPTTGASMIVDGPAEASEAELNKVQQMHSLLHSRFLVTVNSPIEAPELDTQPQTAAIAPVVVAEHVTTQPKVVVSTAKVGPNKHRKRQHQKVLAKTLSGMVEKATPQSQPPTGGTTNGAVAKAQVVSPSSVAAKEQLLSPQAVTLDIQVPYDEVRVTQASRTAVLAAPQPMNESKAPLSQEHNGALVMDTGQPAPLAYLAASASGSSNQTGATASVTTQAGYSATREAKATQPGDNLDTLSGSAGLSTATISQGNEESELALYIEAFDWKAPVAGATREHVTKESREGRGAQFGWQIAQSSDYWPTLYWQNQAPAKKVSVPMISRNTAKILGRLANTILQPEAGIVFGKLRGGERLEFSGRAERVLYFDQQNHVIQGTDLSGARSFALLNSAPGARLIYTASNAAIAIPVLAGTASYLDLTQMSKVAMRGQVMDGGSQSPKPVRGARVSLAGLGATGATTDANGVFDLGLVATLEGLPIYLETAISGGYTHRYRVDFSKASRPTLFRLSNAQIDGYVSQLEGGISNQSGLILGALTDLIENAGEAQHFPVVRSLTSNPTLAVETYTVFASGELEVGTPVSRQNSRFLSVQIPEGPAIAQLEDKGKRILWSEMVMASPNVVNLIGPY